MAQRVIRDIDVRKQEGLPLRKCFQLVMSGIAHRLLRSSLTTSVILLAVAFFTAMLTENMFLNSVSEGVDGMIQSRREAVRRMGFLYNQPSELEMCSYLASIAPAGATPAHKEACDKAVRENAAVSGLAPERVARLCDLCLQEKMYAEFFQKMDIGKRRALISRLQGRDIFFSLVDDGAWNNFLEKLKPMNSLQIPALDGNVRNSVPQMREFVVNYAQYVEELKSYTSTWQQKIRDFAQDADKISGGKPLQAWLSSAPAGDVSRWQEAVNAAGFHLDRDELNAMRERFAHLNLREEVIAALSTPAARDKWKKTFNVEKASLEEKLSMLTRPEVMRDILGGKYDEAQLKDVAKQYLEEKRLNELEAELSGKLDKTSGSILSGRQLFLLVISFVVCMVGIANAMLMAITERFREIATLKCLGATDGYILSQFMLEAALQGLAGGSVGMLIGFLLALVKNSFSYGGYLYQFFPVLGTVVCGLISLCAGILLASLASLYPAWTASRMAPMEAMRVE